MKTIVQFLLAIISAGGALAQTQLVVPGGLANVEGNSSSSGPFLLNGATFQQVYSASEFPSLGAPIAIITGVSFRLDSPTGQRLSGVWPSIAIYLGTTDRSPDNLSPNMNDNTGPATSVGGGRIFLGRATYDPGIAPQGFDILIPFSQPYFYAPSQGNLSMLMFGISGEQIVSLDAEATVGDGIGSVFGEGSTLSGTPSTLGLITRFDITPIPEPLTSSLTLIAFLVSLGVAKLRAMTNRSR